MANDYLTDEEKMVVTVDTLDKIKEEVANLNNADYGVVTDTLKIVDKHKMTRKEAEEILEEVKNLDDSVYQYVSVYMEALDVALESLKQGSINDVLDKIKRDVFNACSDAYYMPVYKLNIDEISEIMDKYKKKEE